MMAKSDGQIMVHDKMSVVADCDSQFGLEINYYRKICVNNYNLVCLYI